MSHTEHAYSGITPCLHLSNLYFRYTHRKKNTEIKWVLSDISLSCNSGEIHLIAGPNGAGKSTLFRILSGLYSCDKGTMSFFGEAQNENTRSRLGVAFAESGHYAKLSILEYLQFFLNLYRPGIEVCQRKIPYWLERFQLNQVSRKMKQLTSGEAQKIQLIRSLLHDPDILLWDEPTTHLDPESQDIAVEILKELAEKGKTILIASHQLRDMESAGTHFAFIKNGHMTRSISRSEFIRSSSQGIELLFSQSMNSVECNVLKSILNDEKYTEKKVNNGILFTANGIYSDEDLQRIIRQIIKKNLPLIGFSRVQPELLDYYHKCMKALN